MAWENEKGINFRGFTSSWATKALSLSLVLAYAFFFFLPGMQCNWDFFPKKKARRPDRQTERPQSLLAVYSSCCCCLGVCGSRLTFLLLLAPRIDSCWRYFWYAATGLSRWVAFLASWAASNVDAAAAVAWSFFTCQEREREKGEWG